MDWKPGNLSLELLHGLEIWESLLGAAAWIGNLGICSLGRKSHGVYESWQGSPSPPKHISSQAVLPGHREQL